MDLRYPHIFSLAGQQSGVPSQVEFTSQKACLWRPRRAFVEHGGEAGNQGVLVRGHRKSGMLTQSRWYLSGYTLYFIGYRVVGIPAGFRPARFQGTEPRSERAAVLKLAFFEQMFKSFRNQSCHRRTGSPIGGIPDPFNEIGRQTDGHSLPFERSNEKQMIHDIPPIVSKGRIRPALQKRLRRCCSGSPLLWMNGRCLILSSGRMLLEIPVVALCILLPFLHGGRNKEPHHSNHPNQKTPNDEFHLLASWQWRSFPSGRPPAMEILPLLCELRATVVPLFATSSSPA
jgi:hypothetical protein